MRPIGSTKDRLAIYKKEFIAILSVIKCDKSLKKSTKNKLTRAYTLLYFTGCRVSEIINLTQIDLINIAQSHILALDGNTKTHRPRTIFFTQKMCEFIANLPTNDVKKYLFYTNKKNKAMSVKGLTMLLNFYLAKYLGELYTTHSFRAGYITRIVEATGNPKTACDLVGHKSVNTTIRYLATSKEQKLSALEAVFKD